MCQKVQYGMRCNDHTSNYVLSLIYLSMVKMKKNEREVGLERRQFN